LTNTQKLTKIIKHFENKGIKFMVATTDTTITAQDIENLPLKQTLALPLNLLRVETNTRFGWEVDEVLPAYMPGIETLKNIIFDQGFYPSKAIEAYKVLTVDDNGKRTLDNDYLAILDGHRRYLASCMIADDLQEEEFIEIAHGEGHKCVYVVLVDPPENNSRALLSQMYSNTSQANTPLDTAKAWNSRLDAIRGELASLQPGVTVSETEAYKKLQAEIEKATNNKPDINTLKNHVKILQLPIVVLNWIQEGFLTDLDVQLSRRQALETMSLYGKDAGKLLVECEKLARAKGAVDAISKVGGLHGNLVTGAWIDSVAVDLGIQPKKTKKDTKKTEEKTIPPSAPGNTTKTDATTASNTQTTDTQNNNATTDSSDDTNANIAGNEETVASGNTTLPSAPGASNKPPKEPTKDRFGVLVIKSLKTTSVGTLLVDANIEELPDGTSQFFIDGISREDAKLLLEFTVNLRGFLGDASVGAEESKVITDELPNENPEAMEF
jgi:hypothetical protein